MRKTLSLVRLVHPGRVQDASRSSQRELQKPYLRGNREYFYGDVPIHRRRTLAGGIVVAIGLAALVNSLAVSSSSGATVNSLCN